MREIPLTQGKAAIVDDEDYGRVIAAGSWHAQQHHLTYYARCSDHQFLHQLITGARGVDHHDGDGLNNRRCNLRQATQSQQRMNQRKSRGSSQFKGVVWARWAGKWRASIQYGRKYRHLGYFESEQEAALRYDAHARELYGSFAALNFPEPSEQGCLIATGKQG